MDSNYYSISKGSLNHSLGYEYLNALSVGKHTITAIFKDGKAEATFNITSKENNNHNNTYPIPRTGIE